MIHQLINISMGSSLIIICSILLKKFIKNIYSNKLFYYLWIILAIRLLIPFEISIPTIETYNNRYINTIDIPESLDKTENVLYIQNHNKNEYSSNNDLISNENFNYKTFKVEHNKKVDIKNLETLIIIIWISGIIFWLLYYFIVQIGFLNKAYKSSIMSNDEHIYDFTKKIADELKLKTIPNIYISSFITSPMLVNPIKPSIIIPNNLKDNSNIDIILKHELIHYKRNDLLFKNIILLASVLHWFNPIVHIMVKKFNESCELVCDEILLKDKNEEYRQYYGKAILDTISATKKSYYVANICFSTTKHVLKDRIKSIMNTRKRKNGFIIAICLLIFMFVSITAISIYRKDIKLNTISSAILSIENNKIDLASELKEYLSDSVERKVDIEIQNYVSSKNEELENIFLTLPSKNRSEAIVITAYYSSKNSFSNSVALSILLDNIRNLEYDYFITNRDIIFAFCNKIEGDKNLNDLLEDRYVNVLNINLENINIKNSDSLFLTAVGDMETDYILHLYDTNLKNQGSRINTFNQDYNNASAFKNCIFLYNYSTEISNNKDIKTSNLDLNSLESLSKAIYDTTKALATDNSGRIFGSSSIQYEVKETDYKKYIEYKSKLEFGQYLRLLNNNSYGSFTCLNNEYKLTADEIKKIVQKYNYSYPTDNFTIYMHYNIEVDNKGEIGKVYSVLSEKPSLEKLESEFTKNFTELDFDNNKIIYSNFDTHMENIFDPYNRKKTNEQINSYNSLKNHVKDQCVNYVEYEEDGYTISTGIEYNQITNEKYRLTIISKKIDEIAHVYQIYTSEDYSLISLKDIKPFIDLITKLY